MKPKPTLRSFLPSAIALASITLTAATIHAASATWNGSAGDGNQWSNTGNWVGPPASVPGSADIATFDATGTAGTIDLGAGGVTVKQIDFNGALCPSYTLGAGAANNQSLTVLGLNPAFGPVAGTLNAGATLTVNATVYAGVSGVRLRTAGGPSTRIFNGDLAPAPSLTGTVSMSLELNATVNGQVKDGAGPSTLFLSGVSGAVTLANTNNSFTGGVQINNTGVLSVSSIKTGTNSCLGPSGTISMGDSFGAGNLRYTGSADTITRQLNFGGANTGVQGGSSSGAILEQAGTGLVKYTSDWTFVANSSSKRLTLQGSTTGTGEMAGIIPDGNPATHVVGAAAALTGATTITMSSGGNSKVPGIGDYVTAAGGGIPAGTYVTGFASNVITLSAPLVGDVAAGETLTFSGITTLNKTGTGTWTVSGANTYRGVTTIGGGNLQVSSLNNVASPAASSSLGRPTDVYHGTIAINGGTLTYTGSGEATDRVVNLSGGTSGATLDQSGTGLLKFTSAFSVPGAASTDRRKTLTLQGSTAGTGEIAGTIPDSTLGTAGQLATSLTKAGLGTWTLSGANTYSGTTSISGGTLRIDAGTGSLNSASALSFGPGTFHYDCISASGSKSQNMGALTFGIGGEGKVQTTKGGASDVTLTFASLAARPLGASGNFVVSGGTNGTDNKIVFTTKPTLATSGIMDKGIYFNGSSYAAYDATGAGFVRAYGPGDANYVSVAGGTDMGTRAVTDNVTLTGDITAQTATQINTINMGANSLTIDNAGAIVKTDGILSSGSSSAVFASGTTLGTIQTSASAVELVVRVDGPTDKLDISARIGNITGACPLTKAGAGTLVLSCPSGNTYQGETRVSAGTLLVNSTVTATPGAVRVRGGATLGGTGNLGGAVTVNGGGIIQPSISGSSGNTLTLSSTTAPVFQAGSILKVRAPSSTMDKVSIGSTTLNIASMDLVVDTTALTGNVSSTAIVELTGASPVITGPFRSVTVVGNTSYTATLDYSTAGQVKLALTGTSGSYSTWASANGISGQPFDGDYDNDGISNGVEYALGLDPITSSQPPGTFTGTTITFTKGLDAIANDDVSWIIETSETLAAGSWTAEVTQSNTNNDSTISYAFTLGSPAKKFARLKVVKTP